MSDELSEVLTRLNEVENELLGLEAQAHDERHRLLSERDQLRDRLAAIHEAAPKGDDRPTAVIRAEIDALEANAEELRKNRIDLVKQAGGGSRSGEMGNLGGTELNRKIDEATGLSDLERRIAELWGILGDRE